MLNEALLTAESKGAKIEPILVAEGLSVLENLCCRACSKASIEIGIKVRKFTKMKMRWNVLEYWIREWLWLQKPQ